MHITPRRNRRFIQEEMDDSGIETDDKQDDTKDDEPVDDIQDDVPEEENTEPKDTDTTQQSDDQEGFPNVPQYMQDRIEGNEDDFELPTEDITIGNDTTNQQNEYNQKDIEILNKSIAEELSSASTYSKNILEVSSDILKKLYADISDEERFHTEQLLYAKSLITGETYEPQDPEVKEEYEKLINNGMNEEDALHTVADRMRLTAGNKDVVDDNEFDDLDDITSQLSLLEMAVHQYNVLWDYISERYSDGEINENLQLLIESFVSYDDSEIFSEATAVVKPKLFSDTNPLKMLFQMVSGIWKLGIRIATAIKRAMAKSSQKMKNRVDWIKKNGWGDLFKEGIHLYFWNLENRSPAMDDMSAYLQLLVALIADIGENMLPDDMNRGDLGQEMNRITQLPQVRRSKTSRYIRKNIKAGLETLKNTVFDKTKVVFDDSNKEQMLACLFATNDIGKSNTHMNILALLYEGSNTITNLMAFISKMIQRASQYDKAPNQDQFRQANGKQANYGDSIKQLEYVSKQCGKISGYFTHDLKVIMKAIDDLDSQIAQTPTGQYATQWNASIKTQQQHDAQNNGNQHN